MLLMRNNGVILGSAGWGNRCFLNDAAYESILLSITFCSRVSCAPADRLEVRASAASGWETFRRKQWQQWHVLLDDVLPNLCTFINSSSSCQSKHPRRWPVSYLWLCFWCELCKNFSSEMLILFCHIRECVSLARSLRAFGKCECIPGKCWLGVIYWGMHTVCADCSNGTTRAHVA